MPRDQKDRCVQRIEVVLPRRLGLETQRTSRKAVRTSELALTAVPSEIISFQVVDLLLIKKVP